MNNNRIIITHLTCNNCDEFQVALRGTYDITNETAAMAALQDAIDAQKSAHGHTSYSMSQDTTVDLGTLGA